MKYDDIYQQSISDPEGFWSRAAQGVAWDKPFTAVLSDTGDPIQRWFAGGMLNTCYNAVDHHVEAGHGARAAIIYESAYSGTSETISYAQLQDRVARFAGVMQKLGLQKGERVLIYMPMIPEAVVAMLACARLGAVHSVVFGGFAAPELAVRIDDCTPRLVVSASCGIEPRGIIAYKPILDNALDLAAHKPDATIIVQRPEEKAELRDGRDHDWHELVRAAEPVGCTSVLATDPLYILYTSGTTGQPKGVVRDNGGHAVALTWSMPNVYGCGPGETYWAASDIGWAVGHSYTVYAPLLNGSASILYEGKPVGTPDAGTFWRIIEKHKVSVLFVAPTAFRAIKREDPDAAFAKACDLSSLRTIFLAGERSDSATLSWIETNLSVPAIDHWWQTETGWPIAANPIGIEAFPSKPGSVCRPMPGWDVRILDAEGREVPAGTIGDISIKLPLPPSMSPTLWNAPDRYRRAYLDSHPGYYATGDAGLIDEDGYVHVHARTDDVINVAGHRLSTGQMEEILSTHQDVSECAVIGVADELKGQIPVAVVVARINNARGAEEIEAELVGLVRKTIGAVASFRKVVMVSALPKTRSGKTLRGVMKKIADGEPYDVPATIEDRGVLVAIEERLKAELHGVAA
ncbi:MAG: prpE [Alphaproteobacteria bacterium]|nr:prpE [Alphaproteobacteria bacterium]